MCVFDALSVNTDRHLGNWGFLVDNDSGDVTGFMPLFDHNLAFFPGSMEKDTFDYHFSMAKPSMGENFTALAREMMTPSIRRDIRKLIGFSFEPVKGYPDWKLEWTGRLLSRQVKEVLGTGMQKSAETAVSREDPAAPDRKSDGKHVPDAGYGDDSGGKDGFQPGG